MMLSVTTSNPTVIVPAWVWIARRAALLDFMTLLASDELFEHFLAMSFEEYESMISRRHRITPTGGPVTASY